MYNLFDNIIISGVLLTVESQSNQLTGKLECNINFNKLMCFIEPKPYITSD